MNDWIYIQSELNLTRKQCILFFCYKYWCCHCQLHRDKCVVWRKCSAEGAAGSGYSTDWIEFDSSETRAKKFPSLHKQIKQINTWFSIGFERKNRFKKTINWSANKIRISSKSFIESGRTMSSPLQKSSSENASAVKQRKSKTTNAAKSTASMDTRTELADLVKRKSEISVTITWWFLSRVTDSLTFSIRTHAYPGNAGQLGTSDLCVRRLLFGRHAIIW